MTKLNQLPISLTQSRDVDLDETAHWPDPERSRHLIILIPVNSEGTTLTRRICTLAKETNSSIQLLGLYRDSSEELALRRELAMMSALIRDAKVYAEIVVEKGNDWVNAVKHNYQAGDIIVCMAEQPIGIRRRPLSQILESSFDAPVYIFSELHPQESKSSVISQLTAWSGLIAIIAGFFLVQVKITQLTTGGFQTLLLILLLPPEIWLIQVWNSLFF